MDSNAAIGKIGSRRSGDAIDLMADRGKAVLHADDDALNLPGAFAGAFFPKRSVATRADQIADLAVKVANGFADQVRRPARRFGKALDLVGDHRKSSSGVAGAGRLDGR